MGPNEIAEAIFAAFLAPHRAATAAQHEAIMARRKARKDKKKRPLTKKTRLVGVRKVKKGEVLVQEF